MVLCSAACQRTMAMASIVSKLARAALASRPVGDTAGGISPCLPRLCLTLGSLTRATTPRSGVARLRRRCLSSSNRPWLSAGPVGSQKQRWQRPRLMRWLMCATVYYRGLMVEMKCPVRSAVNRLLPPPGDPPPPLLSFLNLKPIFMGGSRENSKLIESPPSS